MSSRRLVYALTDPDGAIRYVGFSMTGMRRPRGHMAASRLRPDTPKTRWLRALLALGKSPSIVVLQFVFSDEEGYAAERQWIAKLRAAGARLTNSTDGGDGLRNPSEEVRRKFSAFRTGKKRPPRTSEWCERLSASLTGRKIPPEIVEKSRVKLRGVPLSDEHRQALRESKARQRAEGRLTISDEQRATIAAAARRQENRSPRGVLDTLTQTRYRSRRAAAAALGIPRTSPLWNSPRFHTT